MFQSLDYNVEVVEIVHLVDKFVQRIREKLKERVRRYQRGRQKSLSRKTDKTVANKIKRKTNIEHTTLH